MSLSRVRSAEAVALLALTIATGAVSVGCGGAPDKADSARDLERAVEELDDEQEFDLRDHTSFPWDRLYIFDAGTPRSTISNRLGYGWTSAIDKPGPIRQGDYVLLFEKGHKIRRAFAFRLDIAAFADVELNTSRPTIYNADDAQLRAQLDGTKVLEH